MIILAVLWLVILVLVNAELAANKTKIRETGRPRVSVKLALYDPWIGFFHDRAKHILYFCPLPCVLVKIELGVPQPRTVPYPVILRYLKKYLFSTTLCGRKVRLSSIEVNNGLVTLRRAMEPGADTFLRIKKEGIADAPILDIDACDRDGKTISRLRLSGLDVDPSKRTYTTGFDSNAEECVIETLTLSYDSVDLVPFRANG